MKRNSAFASALLAIGVLAGMGGMPRRTHAQDLLAPPPDPVREVVDPTSPLLAPSAQPGASGLSDWVLYRRPCCESPTSNCPPIASEIFVRSGLSVPISGEALSRNSTLGFSIGAGVRALWFNAERTHAWTLEGHILHFNNSGVRNGQSFRMTVAQPNNVGGQQLDTVDATIRELHRTFVGLGVGQEWYIWAPTANCQRMWRYGSDFGGRWGSGNIELNEIRHQTDVIGNVFVAVHSDMEVPMGNCIFTLGTRLEWSTTWTDRLVQRSANIMEIGLMLNVGMRY